jgi:DNA-binding XRE family transcriptional regulator
MTEPTTLKASNKAPAKRHTKAAEKERAAAAVTFSARLREARQRAGYATLDDVANALGVTREGYGRLERGRIMPRADVLLRLARLFNVSIDWLLGLRDDV